MLHQANILYCLEPIFLTQVIGRKPSPWQRQWFNNNSNLILICRPSLEHSITCGTFWCVPGNLHHVSSSQQENKRHFNKTDAGQLLPQIVLPGFLQQPNNPIYKLLNIKISCSASQALTAMTQPQAGPKTIKLGSSTVTFELQFQPFSSHAWQT